MTDPVSHGFGDKMSMFSLIIDGYERKARLYPALLLLMPIAMIAVAATLTKLSVLEGLGGAAVGCGGALFLSQFARDAGKKGEKALFEKWGGLPSVAVFRHRDIRLDPITKARYHKMLADLVKGAEAPSANDEQADPVAADGVYSAWSILRDPDRHLGSCSIDSEWHISYHPTWRLRPAPHPRIDRSRIRQVRAPFPDNLRRAASPCFCSSAPLSRKSTHTSENAGVASKLTYQSRGAEALPVS